MTVSPDAPSTRRASPTPVCGPTTCIAASWPANTAGHTSSPPVSCRPARRPAIHALYGFARTADDIVDDFTPGVTVEAKRAGLQALIGQFGSPEAATGAVGAAALDTARRYQLDPQLFEDFLTSMQMDLTVTDYETYDDLHIYVWGSAAVIGLMVLPILGTVVPREQAAPYAADLGIAFQLSNFIRDVGEDLRLGRIYLPMESLHRFGVDRAQLQWGIVDDPVRAVAGVSRSNGPAASTGVPSPASRCSHPGPGDACGWPTSCTETS